MIRKLILALGATAAIAGAALTPTTASAWGHHWGHGWGHWGHGYGYGFGIYAPTYVAGPECYTVRRIVETPIGPRPRRVTVCD
jgi:hypothetical protein